jgi:hypothetical protein
MTTQQQTQLISLSFQRLLISSDKFAQWWPVACRQGIFDICKMSALEAEMPNKFFGFPFLYFEKKGEKQILETIKNVKLRVFFVFWFICTAMDSNSILYKICYEDCSLFFNFFPIVFCDLYTYSIIHFSIDI